MKVALDGDALPEVNDFLRGFASRSGWDAPATDRLAAAGEETLAILLQDEDAATAGTARQLAVAAHMADGAAEIEFVTALEGVNGENMEDYLVYLSGLPPVPDEREVSFRLLRHYASSIRHQKYHDVDIVTVKCGGPALAAPAPFIRRARHAGRCRRRMAAGSPGHRHRLLYLDLVASIPIQVRMIHKECLRGIHVLRLKDRIAPDVAVARRGT